MLHGPCSRPFNFHCVRWCKEQRCWEATSQDARKGCRWELERQDLPVAQAQPHSQILQTLEGSSGHGRVQHSSWDWVFSSIPQQEFPDPLPLPTAPLCLGVCYSCLSLEFPCPPSKRADTLHILCLFFTLTWVFPGPLSSSYVICRWIFSASGSETAGLLGTKPFCVPLSLDYRK